MKITTTFITLNDNTVICAPDQATLMTNFVLNEQGDWFEDEIHFVRRFIQPGMKVLDIGANYGLYATALAKGVGETGKLWCFEPTPNTAAALRKTIEKNGYQNWVEIIEAGLSDHEGTATFYLSPNAELNSLKADDHKNTESLTINLLTLDQCRENNSWEELDFIKLDAEGEESNILKQAKQTLSMCSPLIMFELKHGNHINHTLINDFKELGYEPYYLIPGLDVLAPLDLTKPVDGFLLNLFCCKAQTAEKLVEQGWLVPAIKKIPDVPEFDATFFKKNLSACKLPQRTINDSLYAEITSHYIASRDQSLSKDLRYAHLYAACQKMDGVLEKGESKIERMSTYARIAFDIGQRSLGIQICEFIINKYLQNGTAVRIEEAYIPINSHFEKTPQKGNEIAWILASFLDEFVRKHAYSCYFSGAKVIPYFEGLSQLGFLLPDMQRRQKTLQHGIQLQQKKS